MIDMSLVSRMREKEIKWDDIAYILQQKSSTLRSEWTRYQNIKDLPPKIVVRKRKTDGYIGVQIKRLRQEQPQLPIRDFKGEVLKLKFTTDEIPSKTVIHEFLKSNGYILRKLVKKTMIYPRNQLKRVNFCRSMIEKDASFWDRVIWSDETTVRQMPQGKDITVHVHLSTRSEDLPINPQVHSGGFSVMFWGCFSKMGLGTLVALEGSMNAAKYVQLLRDELLPELDAVEDEMIFMQDNAPCHKAKIVMSFLQQKRINTLDWPAQSPDMNPIENLWAIIKARRQKKFSKPKSKIDLVNQIFEIWDSVEPELVSKLADSANRRVSEVLRLNGKVSKY